MNDMRALKKAAKKDVASLPKTPLQNSPYVCHEAKASGFKLVYPRQPNCVLKSK